MSVTQKTLTATIPQNGTVSNSVSLQAQTLAALLMPAAWTTADITFQTSLDGGATWLDIYGDDGNPVKITAPADRRVTK
jgi:hypothetical protein